MITQKEMEYRKAVIHKNAGSELLNVITAEISDRHDQALMRLEDVGADEFREWQGRAKAMRELSNYVQSCLKIKNEEQRSV
jgi:hypothetical protein